MKDLVIIFVPMMKKCMVLLCFIFHLCGCQPEGFHQLSQGCDFGEMEILNVSSASGTLIVSDTIAGMKLLNEDYFIVDTDIDGVYLPLHVCNFDQSRFPYINSGDSLEVMFEGRIEILPETVDAISLRIEINKMQIKI